MLCVCVRFSISTNLFGNKALTAETRIRVRMFWLYPDPQIDFFFLSIYNDFYSHFFLISNLDLYPGFSLRVGSGSCFLGGRIRIWIFVWSGFQFGFFFSWIRSSRIWNPGWNYRKLLVEIWISLTANIDIEAGFSVSRRVICVQIIVIIWLWGAMLPYAIFILSASQSVSHLGKP